MDQFIQYLYEYENGERVRNLGFMKVENKMDKVDIQIYAKQLDEIGGIYFKKQDGTYYIAAWEEPQMQAVSRGIAERVQEATPQDCETKDIEEAKLKGESQIQEVSTQQVQPEPASALAPATRTCEKIQRQDISRLPRKEWKLANNNFLLHGYYNYHHLLYIKEDDKVWIGVPGVFHPREQMAAEGFGFTEFRRDLMPKEENTQEDFGYWCRQVEHF